jgi:hypothetical protein
MTTAALTACSSLKEVMLKEVLLVLKEVMLKKKVMLEEI